MDYTERVNKAMINLRKEIGVVDPRDANIKINEKKRNLNNFIRFTEDSVHELTHIATSDSEGHPEIADLQQKARTAVADLIIMATRIMLEPKE